MERELKDKVVVITGGAQGIGFEIATKFLDKGVKTIVLVDINDEGKESARTLNAKYGENKTIFIKCDVTTDLEETSKKIFDKYKSVDVLINNAGTAIGFNATHETGNKKTIETNLTALILWSMKFWEHMRIDKGGKGGTIINLGSTYGLQISPFIPVYIASKFAVVSFTRSLGHAYNYNRSGVRAVVICPGNTETNFTAEPSRYFEEKQLLKDYKKSHKDIVLQKVESVGRGAIQVFEEAESGTVWVIVAGKPAVEVKDMFGSGYEE